MISLNIFTKCPSTGSPKMRMSKLLDKKGRALLMDLLSNPSSTYTELITDQPFGEWVELLYIPTSGADIPFSKLFFWPILSIFSKKNDPPA